MRVLSPRRFLSWLVGLGVAVCFGQSLAAQDVTITNVRIIVGNGAVVPSGTIIVRGGKIVSASAGAADIQNLKIIDANGMSAMPGFIDAHKHINTGSNEKELILSLLEAGYTTVLSAGARATVILLCAITLSRESDHSVGTRQSERYSRRGSGSGPRHGRQGHQAYR